MWRISIDRSRNLLFLFRREPGMACTQGGRSCLSGLWTVLYSAPVVVLPSPHVFCSEISDSLCFFLIYLSFSLWTNSNYSLYTPRLYWFMCSRKFLICLLAFYPQKLLLPQDPSFRNSHIHFEFIPQESNARGGKQLNIELFVSKSLLSKNILFIRASFCV